MAQKKLKIAYLLSSFPQLSETFILNQITGLLDLGHDVEVFSEKRPDMKSVHEDVVRYNLISKTRYLWAITSGKAGLRLKAILGSLLLLFCSPAMIVNALNVLVFKWHSFSYEYYFWAIRFALYRNKYDILMCHYGFMGNKGAFLKEIGVRGKLFVMFHRYDIVGIEHGEDVYRRLFAHADGVFSISDYNYDYLVQFGAKQEQIIYHPVGVDIDKFKAQNHARGDGQDVINILTTARLVEQKGLEYAIRGIRILLDKYPSIKLHYHIVGSGSLYNCLTDLIAECKLGEYVFLPGAKNQEELLIFLSEANIFLLPSISEALPVCLMEAQASALPIIATDVGSVREMIIDGETGCLIPPAAPEMIAEKLAFLIEHPKEGTRMGRKAREHVSKRYNIKILNRKLSDLFQK